MKSWCNLNWSEKRNIEKGEVNSFDYLFGYDFNVKVKVEEGQTNKEKELEK